MLQLVLVSCVSGTFAISSCPQPKDNEARNSLQLISMKFTITVGTVVMLFWSNYTLPITSEIFLKKKTAPLKQRLEILHLPCHPWILARKKRQARRQLVIMTSLDLSSASWHPCQIMAARVDNIKYMKHFEVSSYVLPFSKSSDDDFPHSVI